MTAKWKTPLLIGVGVAAIAAGAAIAATSGSSSKTRPRGVRVHLTAGAGPGPGPGQVVSSQGYIAATAAYSHLSPAQVQAELREGRSLAAIAAASVGGSANGLVEALMRPRRALIEEEVRAGALSPAGARRRLALVRARVSARVSRSPNYLTTIAIAARYLGLTPATLRARLRAGRSLAEVAGATAGTSAAGLIRAVVKVRERELSEASSGAATTGGVAEKMAPMAAIRARVRAEVRRRGLGPLKTR
jgi:hypothetical protein